MEYNTELFLLLNGFVGRHPALDRVMVFLSVYLTIAVALAFIFYVVVYLPARSSDPAGRLAALAYAGELVLSLALVWVVVGALKTAVGLPRPFQTIFGAHALTSETFNDSFPSMHAALTALIATVASFRNRPLARALFVFAILVAVSRVYVGVHYPLDVAVGFAIGCLIPLAVHRLFRAREGV